MPVHRAVEEPCYTEEEVKAARKALPELVYSDITLGVNLDLNNLDDRAKHQIGV